MFQIFAWIWLACSKQVFGDDSITATLLEEVMALKDSLSTAQLDFQTQISSLELQYQENISSLQLDFQESISALQLEYQENISSLQLEFSLEIQELQLTSTSCSCDIYAADDTTG